MGCGNPKKEVENQMMIMQLERVNIQMEREKNLKLLEEMDGYKRKINSIPDYIDPKFAEEKKKLKLESAAPLIKGGNEVTSSKTINSRGKIGKRMRRKSKKSTNYNINE